MVNKPRHFDLDEIVCPHMFYKYGEVAWQFFDPRQLILLDWIREKLGPMYANNWHYKYRDCDYITEVSNYIKKGIALYPAMAADAPYDLLDERGLRCNLCTITRQKSNKGIVYVSPHLTGQGTDYDVENMQAEEVRQWLIQHQAELPFPIRLEKGVSWVHQDCRDAGDKVTLVNP
jgi:hypothetical protein